MAQVLTAKPISESGAGVSGKESYEINWTIPCWREVRRSEVSVSSQEAVFDTGSPSAWFRTKWLVGLKVVPGGNSGRKARVYWKLLDIKGTQSTKVEAKLQTQLLNVTTSLPKYTDEKNREVKLLEIVEETSECLHFKPETPSIDRELMSPSGKVRFTLKLTLKTPIMNAAEYDRYKMEQFSLIALERLRQNQEDLLNGHSENADLKIFTSDEIEIPVHKTILKAQCPVFAAMLNCDLSENATGIIRMTDISAKTMKIILHYFYVGELLPSWSDPGTIVEFVYAAGKYQMVEVLKLLDDILGRNFVRDATSMDVQLVNLAGKLKLVNAEARLLNRIVTRIRKVTTSGEIFGLFGFEEEEIAELAERLADDKVGNSKILKLVDYMYGSMNCDDLFEKGMSLLAFVRKEDLKKVEKFLLKSLSEMAESVESVDELFQLFGRGKKIGK